MATGYYDGTADITVTSSAADVSGVSGLTFKLDGTTAIAGSTIDLDTLAAGAHTLVITATDALGNASTYSLSFTLHPALTGVVNAVNEGAARGLITSSEQATLVSILNNTTSSVSTRLANFLSAVSGQSGISITTAEGGILTSWGRDLQTRIAAGLAAGDVVGTPRLTSTRSPSTRTTSKRTTSKHRSRRSGKAVKHHPARRHAVKHRGHAGRHG
jgi:hypothetical protein